MLGATLLAFAPSLTNGFAWDDHRLVEKNAWLADPARLPELLTTDFWNTSLHPANDDAWRHAMYRPVVTFALFLERQAFGLDARGFHLVSVLLHLACTLLAWRWLRRRLPGDDGFALAAVAVGTALFALHPSRGEAVGWISGSTELWWALLLLLGFEARASERRWVRVGVAFACFALALLSKETAACAAVLVVLEAVPERRREAFLVSALVVVATALRLTLFHSPPSPATHDAMRPLALFGAEIDRFLEPVWPTVLASLQGAPEHRLGGFDATDVLLGAGLLAIAAAVALFAFRRSALRPVAADLAWLVLPLLPVALSSNAGLFPVGERYLYVPALGAAALVARGCVLARERSRSLAMVAVAVLALILAGAAFVDGSTVRRFASTDALWAYEQELDPTNGYTAWLRASNAADNHDLMLATSEYQQAYALAPGLGLQAKIAIECAEAIAQDTPDADQARLAEVRNFVLSALGERPERAALKVFGGTFDVPSGAALSRESPMPPYLPVQLDLRTGDAAHAVTEAREWLEAMPGALGPRTMLARALALSGDCSSARGILEDAKARWPGDKDVTDLASRVDALCALGNAPADAVRRARLQSELGSPILAQRTIEAARQQSPDDPALAAEATHLADVLRSSAAATYVMTADAR